MAQDASSAEVAVVRRIYGAVAAGDLNDALALLAPSIVVEQSSALPFAGRWVGRDGFEAMGTAIFAAWPDFSVTVLDYLSAGETVLVTTRVNGATRSNRPLDQPMIERWRVQDGQATECQPFYFDPVAAAATVTTGN